MVWRTLPNIRLSSPGLTTYRIPYAKITDKNKMPNDIEQYFNAFFISLFSLFTCPCLVCWRQVEEMRNLNKKSFYFVTLTTGQEAPVYRGSSGEGKGEGVRAEMGEGPFYWQYNKKTKRFPLVKLWAPEQDDVYISEY